MLSNFEYPLLKSEAERKRRRDLLLEPHMKPLSHYLCALRAKLAEDAHIPDFDPCDDGINARAMFLFEAPQTQVQSGFISQENPDQTATNYRGLFAEAGINRKDTLVWNVVPWRVEKHIDATDVGRALPHIQELLSLLPHLEVIVLMGMQTWIAEPHLKTISRANIKRSWTTSALSFNAHKKRPEVLSVFQQVAAILNG
ncbi:hypothetical protein B1R32_107180 [Abditibacterium utsteinense]|uniref:Uracil DNA glycosylase superfamily protein n=1 Tax=Abditibacterium utsteinense TaxID=1960156 RepID=A0A2S8STM2_9BACT|nr:uracil-DNA glycosylase [Abditibacterium utsteinense]PQV64154.1 hypothetical protein B1R32_107180 [Abditibacterium utsteinense]